MNDTVDIQNADDIKIELVNKNSTPYYPDWKVTIDDLAFFVDQDAKVSYDK